MPTYLITGANRGIGLELARQAAARGARVFATCRDPAHAEELQNAAAASDGKIEIFELEVTSDDSLTALKTRIGSQPIDVLINNAGIMGKDPQNPVNMNFAELEHVLAVNSVAPLRVTLAFLANVEAAKGKIAVLSSIMGTFGYNDSSKLAYCVSKTALNGIFRHLARELKKCHVSVVLLHPGWVRTDMGGSSATISPEESARGLLGEIDACTLEKTGRLMSFQRGEMTW